MPLGVIGTWDLDGATIKGAFGADLAPLLSARDAVRSVSRPFGLAGQRQRTRLIRSVGGCLANYRVSTSGSSSLGTATRVTSTVSARPPAEMPACVCRITRRPRYVSGAIPAAETLTAI